MSESLSTIEARIRSGAPLLVVEISPPKGGDPAPLRATAKRFAGKVHAIGVSDNRHGVCMAALAAAGILAAEGADPILHIVTRDRNRLALIANGLGAQALGVRNILCTSGTHQTLGVCPTAKNVFDIDSIHLIEMIAHLGSEGVDVVDEVDRRRGSLSWIPAFAGKTVGPFCVGAVAAPFADPPELQLMRLAKKVAAGAQFLITQPIYDLDRFRVWQDEVTRQGIHEQAAILAGIRPLLDAGAAKTYAAARPFPLVPQAVLDRLSAAGDQAGQRAVGIEIALETIKQVSALKGVRGIHVDAEGDEDAALDIITRSGLEVR